jgi:hypothetical protein
MRAPWAAVLGPAVYLLSTTAFASCEADFRVPALDIVVRDAPVNYRFGLDSPAIAKIADENGMPGLKSEIPFGLTIGRYNLEVTVNSESNRDGSGYCTELRAAHVEIGLKQLDVIIDRRFAPGSCERQAVLDHEAEHVEVFRAALRSYLPALERALGHIALPRAIPVADRNAARAAYVDPITDALKPLLTALNSHARAANARLDTPESYAAVFKRCHGW